MLRLDESEKTKFKTYIELEKASYGDHVDAPLDHMVQLNGLQHYSQSYAAARKMLGQAELNYETQSQHEHVLKLGLIAQQDRSTWARLDPSLQMLLWQIDAAGRDSANAGKYFTQGALRAGAHFAEMGSLAPDARVAAFSAFSSILLYNFADRVQFFQGYGSQDMRAMPDKFFTDQTFRRQLLQLPLAADGLQLFLQKMNERSDALEGNPEEKEAFKKSLERMINEYFDQVDEQLKSHIKTINEAALRNPRDGVPLPQRKPVKEGQQKQERQTDFLKEVIFPSVEFAVGLTSLVNPGVSRQILTGFNAVMQFTNSIERLSSALAAGESLLSAQTLGPVGAAMSAVSLAISIFGPKDNSAKITIKFLQSIMKAIGQFREEVFELFKGVHIAIGALRCDVTYYSQHIAGKIDFQNELMQYGFNRIEQLVLNQDSHLQRLSDQIATLSQSVSRIDDRLLCEPDRALRSRIEAELALNEAGLGSSAFDGFVRDIFTRLTALKHEGEAGQREFRETQLDEYKDKPQQLSDLRLPETLAMVNKFLGTGFSAKISLRMWLLYADQLFRLGQNYHQRADSLTVAQKKVVTHTTQTGNELKVLSQSLLVENVLHKLIKEYLALLVDVKSQVVHHWNVDLEKLYEEDRRPREEHRDALVQAFNTFQEKREQWEVKSDSFYSGSLWRGSRNKGAKGSAHSLASGKRDSFVSSQRQEMATIQSKKTADTQRLVSFKHTGSIPAHSMPVLILQNDLIEIPKDLLIAERENLGYLVYSYRIAGNQFNLEVGFQINNLGVPGLYPLGVRTFDLSPHPFMSPIQRLISFWYGGNFPEGINSDYVVTHAGTDAKSSFEYRAYNTPCLKAYTGLSTDTPYKLKDIDPKLLAVIKDRRSKRALQVFKTVYSSLEGPRSVCHGKLEKLHSMAILIKSICSLLSEVDDQELSKLVKSLPLALLNKDDLRILIESLLMQNGLMLDVTKQLDMNEKIIKGLSQQLFIFKGKMPVQNNDIFFREVFTAGDENDGFVALKATRQEVVNALLGLQASREDRLLLADEVHSAFSLSEIPATEEWKKLAALVTQRQAEFDMLLKQIRDGLPNEEIKKLEFQNLVNWLQQNNRAGDAQQLSSTDKAVRDALTDVTTYCRSEEAYKYYVNALGQQLRLGYKSALLYARCQKIPLYIWNKKESTNQLDIIHFNVGEPGKPAVHMHLTSGFTHFNLLITTSELRHMGLTHALDQLTQMVALFPHVTQQEDERLGQQRASDAAPQPRWKEYLDKADSNYAKAVTFWRSTRTQTDDSRIHFGLAADQYKRVKQADGLDRDDKAHVEKRLTKLSSGGKYQYK